MENVFVCLLCATSIHLTQAKMLSETMSVITKTHGFYFITHFPLDYKSWLNVVLSAIHGGVQLLQKPSADQTPRIISE